MRDFKGMKRQRGRNRSGGSGTGGGGGGGGGGGQGGKPSQNVNRAFDSNGPDNVKIRGHSQHVYEKYQQLARDASGAGDRVLAENYLQHAEHYFRILRSLQPHRTVAEIIGRDALASGYDIDFEDENGEGEDGGDNGSDGDNGQNGSQNGSQNGGQNQGGQQNGQNGDDRQDYRSDQRQDYRSESRDRDNQRRDEPRRDDQRRDENRNTEARNNEPRNSEPRNNEPRNNEPRRDDQRSGEQRSGETRGNNDPRRDGPRRDRFEPRPERTYGRDERQPREETPRAVEAAPRDPMPVVEPEAAAPLTPAPTPTPRAPRTTGSSVLRSRDGEVSHAPAFLQTAVPVPAAPVAEDGEAEVRRPRTRTRRKPAAEVESGGEDS